MKKLSERRTSSCSGWSRSITCMLKTQKRCKKADSEMSLPVDERFCLVRLFVFISAESACNDKMLFV
ncbi:hypothetical protein OIU79_002876 [Salix purpurea]|uniref:Uncharacterized protein n=1 Tax=Salix purpurea TaxID=77065 RepID=A0A9Q0UK60_SALPP|nr:hypothetical protein OIU79_002876 [Salix purpurea]